MVPPLPTEVTTTMAMRAERMHHYLFHEVRNNWLSYPDSVWTLGELGSRLEFSIHNALHMRWSSQPTMNRPDADPTQPDATIPTAFDDPSYDFLGDTYSSHVNYIFWKLHGWIDNRIEDWKAANGVTGEPHWVGTWMGKMEMPSMPGMEPLPPGVHPGFAAINTPEHLQNMEQASQVIAQAGVSRPRFLIDPSLLPAA
jgi:hypothetical protein